MADKSKNRYLVILEHQEPVIAASHKRWGGEPKKCWRWAYSGAQAIRFCERDNPSYRGVSVSLDNPSNPSTAAKVLIISGVAAIFLFGIAHQAANEDMVA